MNVQLFSVFESEGSGSRPHWVFVAIFTLITGALDYYGRYLYAQLAGYAEPEKVAASHAVAFSAVVLTLLALAWIGVQVNHLTGGKPAEQAPLVDLTKNHPPRNLNEWELTSPAPHGIWLRFAHESYLVPELTLEQLETLYRRVKERNNKISFDLYLNKEQYGEKTWKRHEVIRLRKWMLHNQLASEGVRGSVYMRVETTRAIQAAYNALTLR